MKCHYEVLEVEQDASEEDIRKSYYKLALKWHPDKNLHNSEEAKDQFQLIQQAYEVLSDPQERSWYDRHRDSIIKGGLGSDYKDDSLNVYQYFTTTCFKGYGDDENGFYCVYSEVFNKIGAEDSEFDKNIESDLEIPIFGNSNSSYEDIVHPFYSYWQSYSTKKSYSWLDKYDIRDASNRRVLRLMEKENKKIRDKARKERNEEVRGLVAFVRKRDKRIKDHTLYLEQKAVENEKKAQELRKKQIKKRKEEMSTYVECDWSKFSNLEDELQEIEANLAAEFSDITSESNVTDSDGESNYMPQCIACNKIFKTNKGFLNHERSKKHKENFERLELIMKMEDAEIMGFVDNSSEKLDNGSSSNVPDNYNDEEQNGFTSDEEYIPKQRKKNKTKKLMTKMTPFDEASDNDSESNVNLVGSGDEDKPWTKTKARNKPGNKKKQKISFKQTQNSVEDSLKETTDVSSAKQHSCAVCNNIFSSKNELFKHLRATEHSVPTSDKIKSEQTKTTKKGKKK